MANANDTQIGGTHYASQYQHWDFVGLSLGSGYFKGVITKYITRWRKKNGMEDLQKARHFLVKMIELVNTGQMFSEIATLDAMSFCAANKLLPLEAVAFDKVCCAGSAEDALEDALTAIDNLIEAASKGEDGYVTG